MTRNMLEARGTEDSMSDVLAGSLKNLFGRRRSRVQAKQVRPQRNLSEETNHA